MPIVHKAEAGFAILSSAARMPASCWGRYRHCAVVRLREGSEAGDVRMISPRSRAIEEILWQSSPAPEGKTARSGFSRAMAEAREVLASHIA